MVLENVWMENKDKVVLIEDWMRQLGKRGISSTGKGGESDKVKPRLQGGSLRLYRLRTISSWSLLILQKTY
jgi:hypothetical protein